MEGKKDDEKLKEEEKKVTLNILKIKLSETRVLLKSIIKTTNNLLIKYINILNIYIKKIINNIKNIKLSTLLKIFWVFLTILIIFYLALVIFAWKIQMNATFPKVWVTVSATNPTNLNYEEINFEDSEWYNINWLYLWNETWTWETVYYFHWNGGPLESFYSEIDYINNLGYNVMAFDYPGYWKSEWKPYKENIDDFSEEFYNYVKEEKNISDEDLIIWWYSVWTAVATDFASKNDFSKLILVSPFASRYEMAKSYLWVELQKYLFLKNSYITKDIVSDFTKPVLIIHWNKDKIVSFNQWTEVFENYSSLVDIPEEVNKNFIELDNFWHNWILTNYWNSLENIFKDFLNWKDLWFEDNHLFISNEVKESLEFENNLDFYTDESTTKFLSANVSFNDLWYIPEDLEKIESEYVYDTKWWYQTLRKVTNNALQKMAEDFYYEYNTKFRVVSAYRSYAYQKGIKDRWCPDNLCSKAWYSEHQSGLGFDIFEASSEESWSNNSILRKYFAWMNENAYKYGFHNTYQKWLEIDTYEVEPWHWRYVWIPFATYLRDNDLTIAEYYNKRN